MSNWSLTIPQSMYRKLHTHLFPGDNDEHGAVILAGVHKSDHGPRLIAREIYLAEDGNNYVKGERGYRMLRAEYIGKLILRARDMQLSYLAIHNHGGYDSVNFSSDDMASHERGYPALLEIANGMPVGALVFAKKAVAGDLWLPDRSRRILSQATIIGHLRETLHPYPKTIATTNNVYDRQSRLFGDAGQEILKNARVGIVGLGGAGSIIAELLGRLGVGNLVLADPDRAEYTNLPRLIAARKIDAVLPRWLPKSIRNKFRTKKVKMAARNIRRANNSACIDSMSSNILNHDSAEKLKNCDFIFLAADSMGARLIFNAIVHQYGIPGIQVGAKVPIDKDGKVGDVFCVSRMVTPESGCLLCNELIDPVRLQAESLSQEDRAKLAYVADSSVIAPSVISLNAIACSHAVDDFLFYMTGLKYNDAETGWFMWNSRQNRASYNSPRKDKDCIECSSHDRSRLGMGDYKELPTKNH